MASGKTNRTFKIRELESKIQQLESGFLLRNEGTDNRIYPTDDLLQRLCELETIYADGTFQVCPAIFAQLFTINER